MDWIEDKRRLAEGSLCRRVVPTGPEWLRNVYHRICEWRAGVASQVALSVVSKNKSASSFSFRFDFDHRGLLEILEAGLPGERLNEVQGQNDERLRKHPALLVPETL
jgi:hypothetical protein